MLRSAIISVISFLLFSVLSIAQSPQTLNYQAVVRDGSGNIIPATDVGMRISILQGSETGSAVCVEEFSPTTNDYGLVTLKIGSDNTTDFQAIDWSAGPYFVKVEVDETGGTSYVETGTSQLLSVPYALHAEEASGLAGADIWKNNGSDTYYDSGNVGIGTDSPNARLSVDGDDLPGTAGSKEEWLRLYGSSGNIDNLYVFHRRHEDGSDWNSSEIVLQKQIDNTPMHFISFMGSPGNSSFLKFGYNNTTHLSLDKYGNIGIGVENPASPLHIKGPIQMASNTETVLYQNVSESGIPDNDGYRIRFNPSWLATNMDALIFEKTDFNSTDPDGAIAFVNTGNDGVEDHTLTIRGNGRVGVGTSSPTGKLGVETESGWSDEVPLFEVKNKDGTPVFAVYNNGIRVLIEDDPAKKGPKGGFAIGGFDRTKSGSTVDFMRITPDSIRFNINNEASTKGPKGGFAIGGFDRTKGGVNEDFMYITPQSSDAGRYNAFIGYRAGYNNTGNYNSFMGYYAGYSNTSGSYNTLLGYQAGVSNQTGSNNVLIGYKAGNKGDQNVFIGNNTGRSNTTGNSNVAIGYQSGFNNSTGSNNVFIGNQSGWYNTSGSNNTFIGWKTGLHNEDGYRNVFLGESAGSANRSGSNNVFLGFEAGRSNLTGNSNVFIGRRTGLYTTEGSNNVFIGLESGLRNTSGIDNSIIGHQAGYYNTTGHDNVFFGYKAGLHNTTAKNNVFLGSGAGSANRDGEGNVFVGFEAGRSNLHGSYNVFIGRYAGLNELGDQKLYIDNYWTSSPLIYGDFNANLLRVNGNLQYTGSLSHYSDIRMKTNITEMVNVLDKINDFRGVYFDWDDEIKENHVVNGRKQIGIIAQEVEKVFPELVSENDGGYKMVDYVKLTPILLQAIKEQQAEINKMESRMLALEQMVMEMAAGEE